jgi:hypothetical protein
LFLCGQDAARRHKNENGLLGIKDGTASGDDIVDIPCVSRVSVSLFLCVLRVNSISQKRA